MVEMKIVINSCFGGFGLSEKAMMRYAEIKGITLYPEKQFSITTYYTVPKNQRTPELKDWRAASSEERKAYNTAYKQESIYDGDMSRTDPILIQVVEELGKEANGMFANLKVVEIPDGIEYEIDDYDGQESIHEVHRSWD
jgi:hypothetical protein